MPLTHEKVELGTFNLKNIFYWLENHLSNNTAMKHTLCPESKFRDMLSSLFRIITKIIMEVNSSNSMMAK